MTKHTSLEEIMKNIERPGSITVYCKECGKAFKSPPSRIKNGRSVFCSRECASAWKSKAYKGKPGTVRLFGPDNPNWKGKSAEKICPVCHKVFKSRNKTCSAKCGHILQAYKIFKQNGKARSVLDGKRGREIAKRVYGDKCAICGFDRFIEYAHIIPARRGGTIHPDNIIPLCPNHHRLYDKNLLNEEEWEIMGDWLILAWGSENSMATPSSDESEANAP